MMNKCTFKAVNDNALNIFKIKIKSLVSHVQLIGDRCIGHQTIIGIQT